MIKKYKNIVAAGCSFIEGSNIYEAIITPGKNREVVWTGRDHRMSKLLAKKLVIPEVLQAKHKSFFDQELVDSTG